MMATDLTDYECTVTRAPVVTERAIFFSVKRPNVTANANPTQVVIFSQRAKPDTVARAKAHKVGDTITIDGNFQRNNRTNTTEIVLTSYSEERKASSACPDDFGPLVEGANPYRGSVLPLPFLAQPQMPDQ